MDPLHHGSSSAWITTPRVSRVPPAAPLLRRRCRREPSPPSSHATGHIPIRFADHLRSCKWIVVCAVCDCVSKRLNRVDPVTTPMPMIVDALRTQPVALVQPKIPHVET